MKTRRCLDEEGYMYPTFDCVASVVVTRVCCWTTAWNGVLEKLLPACDGTRMFITMPTRSWHFYLSWARWIQSTSSQSVFFKIDFRFILPCNVCLNLPSHFSTTGFSHQNSVRIYCLPRTCHMPLASLILDLITPVLRSTNHYASNYVFFSITHRSKYSIVDES